MDNTLQNNYDITDDAAQTIDVQSMLIPAACADAVVAAFKQRAADEGWIGIVTNHSGRMANSACERSYTLTEAANHFGVREDDLIAILPDIAIVVESPMVMGFTEIHMELLEQLIDNIHSFAGESMYGGGDL